MSRKSEHILWLEGKKLSWKSVEGKKVKEGEVVISNIEKMELYKKGSTGKNSRQ